MQIYLSSNPDNLREALAQHRITATVEAEYGDVLVLGSACTLAHHGSRSDNPCPCLHEGAVPELEAIGLSHIDLDALGGTLALMGQKPEDTEFWTAAAAIDVQGVHKRHEMRIAEMTAKRLDAWYAWAEGHRCFPPRDGSVAEVQEFVEEARIVLAAILDDEPGHIEAGERWSAAQASLDAQSYLGVDGAVILRAARGFTNHLYYSAALGHSRRGVASLKLDTGAVTVSIADPIPGVSCVDVVQVLWGPTAGGHAGIAGSPREWPWDPSDPAMVAARTLQMIRAAQELARRIAG